jgi:hypothetical protein
MSNRNQLYDQFWRRQPTTETDGLKLTGPSMLTYCRKHHVTDQPVLKHHLRQLVDLILNKELPLDQPIN